MYSFAVAAFGGEGKSVNVDLACCAFSDSGKYIDAAHCVQPSMLQGAVRHCGDNPVGATAADQDTEIVHVYPALVPEDCCLLMFIITGELLPDCEALTVTSYAKERKKGKVCTSSSCATKHCPWSGVVAPTTLCMHASRAH